MSETAAVGPDPPLHMSPPQSWRPSPLRQTAWLVGFIALTFSAAAIGSAATSTSVGGWYQTLAKPPFNPPDWIFGPVWTLLYLMMAIAAWLVWRRGGWVAGRVPLALFGVQLALNVLWSVVFFGLRQPGWAMVEIVFLWLAILAALWSFATRSGMAAWLLAPYLAWTSFAAVLNAALWRLNG